MAFWGVEVRPGKPYTHSFDPARGRLRLCQATLGIGVAITKSLVQCNVGRKSPVFLCALLPDKTESCHLDLEFEESEEVIFSVIGPRSVHLTGYYSANGRKGILDDNSESYGEDIANTDSHESANSSADKYEDSFINDDDLEVSPFPDPDDEDIKDEKKSKKRLKKKYQIIESDEDVSSKQENFDTECNRENSTTHSEDENEDNLVISTLNKTKMSRKGRKTEMNTNGILLKEKEGNVIPTKAKTNVLDPKVEKNEHTVTGINGLKKKYKTIESDEDVSSKQEKFDTVCKRENSTTQSEDENEDNLVISTLNKTKMSRKGKKAETNTNGILLKEKEGNVIPTKAKTNVLDPKVEKNDHTVTGINGLHTVGNDEHTVTGTNGESDRRRRPSKKRKKQLDNEEEMTENVDNKEDKALQHELPDQKSLHDKPLEINVNQKSEDDKEDKKTKRKKRKRETKEKNVEEDLSKSRTLTSGLIIEELQKGKNVGKTVAPGKKVKVFLTARLKDTGTVFYSNMGKSPHKFVIGAEEGLHIGMDGMQVGDKRRLTVPPSMRYGGLGGGEDIPPNSWLVYEVELISVH